MAKQNNDKIIDNAFLNLIKRKDLACQKALSAYMQKAVEKAMNLHDIIWSGDGKTHTYHNLQIRDEFGWALCHNGQILEMGMADGGKIAGRYSDLMSELAKVSPRGWVGHIVSIVEPLELRNGHILYYKREFEEYVFDEIEKLTVSTFKTDFTATLRTI